jgi:hypothetical protein
VGVWCALRPRRIIGPIFFHETTNSDWYINDIMNPFFNQLTAEERQYGFFSKITLQHILLMQPWLQYGWCLKTE